VTAATGASGEPAHLFPVGGKIPFNQRNRHFGEGFAFGLGEVDDVDDSEPHNSPFLRFSVLGGDPAGDGGEDLQSPFTASHVLVEFLASPVPGLPARCEPAGQGLRPDQSRVGEGVVVEASRDGQGPLPVP
jgi:hypothetical protein